MLRPVDAFRRRYCRGKRTGMPRWGRTLSARILVAVLGIMALTMLVGLALYLTVTRRTVDERAVEQATSIAVTLGNAPGVASAVEAGDPDHALAGMAERIRRAARASY